MKARILLTPLFLLALACHASGDTFGSGANTFDIDFVTIGNPGNVASANGIPFGAGSVPYTYRMGQFEISEQMIDKANTLGGLGITKDTRGSDKPATSVSWSEVARFINWLNTSTGNFPAYKLNVNGGPILWASSDAGYDPNNKFRNSLAHYFLPSVDEWYKAAFYDPTSGVYFDFPTGSNTQPTAVASGTTAGTAVYGGQSGPANITLAGGLSPYGTMGQGGNVNEWEETNFDLTNDSSAEDRGVRGGYWLNVPSILTSAQRSHLFPTNGSTDTGFRVASSIVPEPSTAILAASIFALLASRRYRRQPRR